MPLMKGASWRRTALDAVQAGLPLSGHDRALHLRMDDFDQLDALVGRLQALAVAHDVLALQQHLDDGRAGGRRTEAGLFHGVGELFLIERLAGGFHRGEQRPFGEALGRAGLLFQNLGIQHVLRLAFGKPGRQFLFGGTRPLRVRPSSPFAGARSNTFQPTCCTALPEVW